MVHRDGKGFRGPNWLWGADAQNVIAGTRIGIQRAFISVGCERKISDACIPTAILHGRETWALNAGDM